MTQQEIENILQKEHFQNIIQEANFYFLKGQLALKNWLKLKVSDQMQEDLIRLSSDYTQFVEIAEINPEIEEIKDILFEIIAYCDNRAKDKSNYNQYDGNRVLADASVRMGHWVDGLMKFKFKHAEITGKSILNAFNYLLSPQNNCTILSDNHRKMVSVNLLKKNYSSSPNFIHDLKKYFNKFELKLQNQENYTYLISSLIYAFRTEWIEEVIALMASDGTDWQKHVTNLETEYSGLIVWNSKKPSGGKKILDFLIEKLKDGQNFALYYSSKGYVRYKANIIDFAINGEELTQKKWNEKKIKNFYSNFGDYKDDKKKARILFLVESMEEISPKPISDFKFYDKYSQPRQDNLSPIKEIINDEIVIQPKLAMTDNNPNLPLNQIVFGPPGTGKTYHTINKAIQIANPEFDLNQERSIIKKEFDRLMDDGIVEFITFHQSMSYEDFVEGIKPETLDNRVIYDIQPGIFKQICQAAATPNLVDFKEAFKKLQEELSEVEMITLNTPTGREFGVSLNSNENLTVHTGSDKKPQGSMTMEKLQKQINGEKQFIGWEGYFKGVLEYLKTKFSYSSQTNASNQNYVLIIDEINRGNVSQIFGELITLIEKDKRAGNDEALEVTLPYSKDKFSIPANLYIIGTMNTADRSVEALDSALRRRFSFQEMPPRYDLEELDYSVFGYKASSILKMINHRIEKLLDKDHMIGHSFFIEKDHSEIEAKILNSFYENIIPLLQEYFFGDFGKIGLVLGEGFVEIKKLDNPKDGFATFNYDGAGDFEDRAVFEIIDYRNNIEDTNSSGFRNAIKILMNDSE